MTRRAVQMLLVGSLILNLFLLGGVVGVGIMWQRAAIGRPSAAVGQGGRLREAAQLLSPPYRRQLRQAVVDTMRALKPQMAEARAARHEAGRLLTAPTLDRAALTAALTHARTADGAMRVRLESRMVDYVATLPPGERAALGRALMGRSGGVAGQ